MKISIIISTHGEGRDLPRILSCLSLQRRYEHVEGKLKGSGHYAARGYLFDNIPYVDMSKYLEPIIVCHGEFTGDEPPGLKVYDTFYQEGTFGHHAREMGIQMATGDFIALTSSDNLYVDGFLDRIIHFINKYPKLGLLHWKCVNNYSKWGTCGGPNITKMGSIDLCCALVKAPIAKKVGFPWRHMSADFDFIDACRKMCEKRRLDVVYVPEILAIHN